MTENGAKRRALRLGEFDYSRNGAYFVTVCTLNREHVLCRVTPVGAGVPDGPGIQLTEYGKIVEEQILEIHRTYPDVSIDKYVVMPNHVHLLISLATRPGAAAEASRANARIPALISTFKRFTNKKCGVSLWQRSYYDHIIRDENDYFSRWTYIDENPAKWACDEYYT